VKIYQDNVAYPTRVHAFVSFMASQKESLSKKDINEKLCPAFMGNNGGLVNSLVNATVESGILQEEHGLFSLVDQTPSGVKIDKKSVKTNFPKLFAEFALQANLPNGEENSFAKLAAWFLKQDPLSLPPNTQGGKEQMRDQMELAKFATKSLRLDDGSIRDNLIKWCNYLGLCTFLHERMIPDPTTFLRWQWKEFKDLAKNNKIKVIDFHSKVGQLCPVLDSGAVCEKIKDKKPAYPEGYFSKSLSLAMIRLEAEGFFEIQYGAETRDGMNIYLNSDTTKSATELRKLA
jgi:hypothetical protein